MPFIEMFFRHTVQIKPFLRQGNGEPVFGQVTSRKCRFQSGKFMKEYVRDIDGVINAIPSHAKMFSVGDPIPVQSIVTHNNVEYVVTGCKVASGFVYDHLEVMLE